MTNSYNKWRDDPTSDNLSGVISKLQPVITAEAYRYGGGPVIEAKAKQLAIGAVGTYNPDSGARLSSWVVTQMQPLARYKTNMQPIRIPEVANARSAELNRMSMEFEADNGYSPTDEELADFSGVSIKQIKKLRGRRKAVVSESSMEGASNEEEFSGGGMAVSRDSKSLGLAAKAVYEELDDRSRLIYDHAIGANGRKLLDKREIARRLGVTPAYISIRTNEIAKDIANAERLFR